MAVYFSLVICIGLIVFVAYKRRTAGQSIGANVHSVIDHTSDKVVYNGHTYTYDIATGATALPSRPFSGKMHEPLSTDVKEQLLHWSVQPPKGLIMGEYYCIQHEFGSKTDPAIGKVEAVIDRGKIVHIEMDEKTPHSYYNHAFSNVWKRKSGYTFFQFAHPRTDITQVTWANGVTFLEWQILKANSFNLDLETVRGSSNSALDAFIPAVQKLAEQVKAPSGLYYIGYSLPLKTGITPRLEVIFNQDRIVAAHYDEFFADTKEGIHSNDEQQFYRQSRHDSIEYNKKSGGVFLDFCDRVLAAIVRQNKVLVSECSTSPFYANYEHVAKKMRVAVRHYLSHGYTHTVGTLTDKPALAPEKDYLVSWQGQVVLTVLDYHDDLEHNCMHITVQFANMHTQAYQFSERAFYIYVKNEQNTLDTIGTEADITHTIQAQSTQVLDLIFAPLFLSDTNYSRTLMFAGPHKIFFHHQIPAKTHIILGETL